MRVISLLPCMEIRNENKLFNIKGAGVSQCFVDILPDKNGLAIFCHIEAEDVDRTGAHRAEFKLVLGKEIIASKEMDFSITEAKANMKLLTAIEFTYPSEGRYQLAVFLDGLYATHSPIDVFLRVPPSAH